MEENEQPKSPEQVETITQKKVRKIQVVKQEEHSNSGEKVSVG